jgi:NAD+ synthase (glutamine-hydrolysing)
MYNNGFIRVASATPKIKVGFCNYNLEQIKNLVTSAIDDNVSLVVFPELCITGYTCGDLFFQRKLQDEAINSLVKLKNFSINKDIIIIVGAPVNINNSIFNCGCVISNGSIIGIVPKTYLPSSNEFYERRWFSSSVNLLDKDIIIDNEVIPLGTDLIFSHTNHSEFKFGIEICEDLWSPLPPSSNLAVNGATIIVNPSASNDLVGKSSYRKELLSQQSARTISSYIYSSCGFGESTTDVVFGGHCLIYENGIKLKESPRFQLESNYITSDIDLDKLTADRIKSTAFRDACILVKENLVREVFFNLHLPDYTIERFVDPHPFVPNDINKRTKRCEEIFSIQTFGLAKRISHIGCNKAIIGISGGLDSTLALLVTVKTFDLLKINRKNIIGVTMPGFGTTDRTYNNAVTLINNLGITLKEISIKDACLQHFKDINHDSTLLDITYENSQARERTQVLMDLSNKENGIVIGTGDLSELALGWATYNGDHMSMYAVNSSIPKTLVRYLVDWVANTQVDEITRTILMDILDTPVSPELLPPDLEGNIIQKTEEVVGPYELHDFFLYNVVRFGFSPKKIYYIANLAFSGLYEKEIILYWLKTFYKRFFSQQFKRSCLPDGPKVGSICLSPRGDWRMPSDAAVNLWMDELNTL